MYPCVGVSYAVAVYGQFNVRFVESEQTNLKAEEVDDAFVVVCPKPFTVDERLTLEARQALINVVQYASKKSGRRMCVVFAKSDCVYVESEGTAKPSTEPPSGGIRCIRFPIRFKET